MMPLILLYRDEHYVAVHKPANLLVHRSWLASQERHTARTSRRSGLNPESGGRAGRQPRRAIRARIVRCLRL